MKASAPAAMHRALKLAARFFLVIGCSSLLGPIDAGRTAQEMGVLSILTNIKWNFIPFKGKSFEVSGLIPGGIQGSIELPGAEKTEHLPDPDYGGIRVLSSRRTGAISGVPSANRRGARVWRPLPASRRVQLVERGRTSVDSARSSFRGLAWETGDHRGIDPRRKMLGPAEAGAKRVAFFDRRDGPPYPARRAWSGGFEGSSCAINRRRKSRLTLSWSR